jgi:hypothetical protein
MGISLLFAALTLVVPIQAMNASGENGTATFTAQGDKTLVVIDLSNGSATRQPSHLHAGTCDDYTPRPSYGLSDVVNGKSRTVVSAPFERLVNGSLIVNVHHSYDDIATQSACGIVKR